LGLFGKSNPEDNDKRKESHVTCANESVSKRVRPRRNYLPIPRDNIIFKYLTNFLFLVFHCLK